METLWWSDSPINNFKALHLHQFGTFVSRSAANCQPTRPHTNSKRSTVAQDPKASDAMPRKQRGESTYAVRKRERQALVEQAGALDKQLEALRAQKLVVNALLRQAAHTQHRAANFSRAALSGLAQSGSGESPFEGGIVLPSDDEAREKLLSDRRAISVRLGRAFVAERRQFLDESCGSFNESSAFETRAGDACVTRFSVMPIEMLGRSEDAVKRAMDAAMSSLANAELVISETSEFITIRQDGDWFYQHGPACLADRGVALQRVLSANAQGSVLVESEAVSFAEFFETGEAGVAGPHGIITTEVVEHDAAYPYHPKDRVRRDVSSVILISSPRADTGGDGTAVLLTVWSNCTFRRPTDAASSAESVRSLQPKYMGWGGGMIEDMQQILQCSECADA